MESSTMLEKEVRPRARVARANATIAARRGTSNATAPSCKPKEDKAATKAAARGAWEKTKVVAREKDSKVHATPVESKAIPPTTARRAKGREATGMAQQVEVEKEASERSEITMISRKS